MPVGRIDVVGLRDLQRALRQVEKTLPRELRKVNLQAAEVVAEGTRASLRTGHGPSRRTIPSVRALAQQRNASVRVGGRRYPYAMGVLWGSHRFRQFLSPRKGGYHLYPTIRARREEVMDRYEKLLDELMTPVFPD